MIVGNKEVPEYLQNQIVEFTRVRRTKATGLLELEDGQLFDVDAHFAGNCLCLQVQIQHEILNDDVRCEAAKALVQKALADPDWGNLAMDLRDGEVLYQAVFNVERTSATVEAFLAASKLFLKEHGLELADILDADGGLDLPDIGLSEFLDGFNC